jgi:hypothetical protein
VISNLLKVRVTLIGDIRGNVSAKMFYREKNYRQSHYCRCPERSLIPGRIRLHTQRIIPGQRLDVPIVRPRSERQKARNNLLARYSSPLNFGLQNGRDQEISSQLATIMSKMLIVPRAYQIIQLRHSPSGKILPIRLHALLFQGSLIRTRRPKHSKKVGESLQIERYYYSFWLKQSADLMSSSVPKQIDGQPVDAFTMKKFCWTKKFAQSPDILIIEKWKMGKMAGWQ